MNYRFTVQGQTLAKLTFDAKSRKLSWANINSVRELIVASKMVTCKSFVPRTSYFVPTRTSYLVLVLVLRTRNY